MINSVLDSIPTYSMSLHLISSNALKQLDKTRRNFLGEGNNKSHKFHFVKWPIVLLPKKLGGLGIES